MAYTLVRNLTINAFPMPYPFKGIIEPGGGRVIPLSLTDTRVALGGAKALNRSGISLSELPVNYSGDIDSFNYNNTLPNFPPVDYGGLVTKVYVRTTGSDTMGDGKTADTAYRTLAFALAQTPMLWTNGCYFFDITGITESLTTSSVLPNLPDFYVRKKSLIYSDASGLYFGIVSPVTIHSDLVVAQTIAAVDVLSATADSVTGQKTIVTSGGLTVNALIGKIARQGTTLVGVVKSNTATDILLTGTGGTAAIALELCDPGAQLNNLTIGNNLGDIQIEGVKLDRISGGTFAITTRDPLSTLALYACTVGTFYFTFPSRGYGGLAFCYVIPATSGNTNCYIDGNVNISNSFLSGVGFVFGGNTGRYNFISGGNGFKSCGPLGQLLGGGAINTFNFTAQIAACDFITPGSYAVFAFGNGHYNINTCKVNNAPSGGFYFDGFIRVDATNLPAGTGNGGNGITLLNGANLIASGTNVAITGAADVKIGNLVAQTWTSVTGSTNNRVTDSGANGDGSSAKRT